MRFYITASIVHLFLSLASQSAEIKERTCKIIIPKDVHHNPHVDKVFGILEIVIPTDHIHNALQNELAKYGCEADFKSRREVMEQGSIDLLIFEASSKNGSISSKKQSSTYDFCLFKLVNKKPNHGIVCCDDYYIDHEGIASQWEVENIIPCFELKFSWKNQQEMERRIPKVIKKELKKRSFQAVADQYRS